MQLVWSLTLAVGLTQQIVSGSQASGALMKISAFLGHDVWDEKHPASCIFEDPNAGGARLLHQCAPTPVEACVPFSDSLNYNIFLVRESFNSPETFRFRLDSLGNEGSAVVLSYTGGTHGSIESRHKTVPMGECMIATIDSVWWDLQGKSDGHYRLCYAGECTPSVATDATDASGDGYGHVRVHQATSWWMPAVSILLCAGCVVFLRTQCERHVPDTFGEPFLSEESNDQSGFGSRLRRLLRAFMHWWQGLELGMKTQKLVQGLTSWWQGLELGMKAQKLMQGFKDWWQGLQVGARFQSLRDGRAQRLAQGLRNWCQAVRARGIAHALPRCCQDSCISALAHRMAHRLTGSVQQVRNLPDTDIEPSLTESHRQMVQPGQGERVMKLQSTMCEDVGVCTQWVSEGIGAYAFVYAIFGTKSEHETVRTICIQCPGAAHAAEVWVSSHYNIEVTICRKEGYGLPAVKWVKQFQIQPTEGVLEYKEDSSKLEYGIYTMVLRTAVPETQFFRAIPETTAFDYPSTLPSPASFSNFRMVYSHDADTPQKNDADAANSDADQSWTKTKGGQSGVPSGMTTPDSTIAEYKIV